MTDTSFKCDTIDRVRHKNPFYVDEIPEYHGYPTVINTYEFNGTTIALKYIRMFFQKRSIQTLYNEKCANMIKELCSNFLLLLDQKYITSKQVT
uniref:Uncharacterized protein n=1 Tax=Lepeophtheirus salmonis TaxID=72036 RepID=A0A0K2UMA6_LEPSM